MALDLAKYGATPVAAAPAASAPAPALDLTKYGAKPTAPTAPLPRLSPFGNPAADIKAAGSRVHDAITAQGEFAGQNALERGTGAAAAAAVTVPTVIADVIPGGKQALDLVSKGFQGFIDLSAHIPQHLADLTEKIGVMSPEQRQRYDKNNADFAGTPEAIAIVSAARVGKNLGDVANTILMADGTARGTQDLLENKIPKFQATMRDEAQTAAYEAQNATQAGLVDKTANEIAAVENKYAKGRNANLYSKDAGTDSRQRIAQSGVLKYSVNEDGLVQTKQPGGSVDRYKAMTIDPAEGVVRANLEREGSKVSMKEVQSVLEDRIRSSGLQGADFVNALNMVRREVAGIRMKADSLGYVPTTLLHDAKINTTSNINYFTPAEVSKARKAIANGYKTLVEDNSRFNVREVNAELAKYYDDIARLERLDGARVSGGRLGKYTAQISGNIIGGAFGSVVGGPIGAAMGAVIGGETTAAIKGKAMARTFNAGVESKVPANPILDKAVEQGKALRPMLPPGSGMRSSKPSGPTINLPARGQTKVEADEAARAKKS